MANHDDDRGLDRGELDRWPPPEPRASFVDDVMARLDAGVTFAAPAQRAVRQPRTRTVALAGFAAGAIAVSIVVALIVALRGGAAAPPVGGRLEASARRTLAIGSRGVAVAEAGSELEWRVDADRRAVVVQQRGRVFYRVDAGGPFRVTTPHGEVEVLGTCFTVAVETAATRVTTHEGRVAVAGAGVTLILAAGEVAALGPAGPRSVDDVAPPAAAAPVAVAGAGGPAPPAPSTPTPLDDDRAALFETDAPTLARWAEECRIRVDLAPVTDAPFTDQDLDQLGTLIGLRRDERDRMRVAIATTRERTLARLRRLYTDATGDDPGAMPSDALMHEILRTAELGEEGELRRRIARERAGLEPPPPASARLTPLEETIRAVTVLGDEFEAEVARVLGPARARELRRAQRGWPGGEFHWLGCPAQ